MIQRDMKAILRLSLLNIVDSLDLEEQVRKRRQFSAQELLPGVKTIVADASPPRGALGRRKRNGARHARDEQFLLGENESTFIPLGVRHRLENPGCVPLPFCAMRRMGCDGRC
jgi:hypothetical protein